MMGRARNAEACTIIITSKWCARCQLVWIISWFKKKRGKEEEVKQIFIYRKPLQLFGGKRSCQLMLFQLLLHSGLNLRKRIWKVLHVLDTLKKNDWWSTTWDIEHTSPCKLDSLIKLSQQKISLTQRERLLLNASTLWGTNHGKKKMYMHFPWNGQNINGRLDNREIYSNISEFPLVA